MAPSKTQKRGELTRRSLMDAAEKLIAANGRENTTLRAIIDAAGQKNESALHYHFKDMNGLILALHQRRSAQIVAKRRKLIDEITQSKRKTSLRDVCRILVQPVFDPAVTDAGYRRYIKAFGYELALKGIELAEHFERLSTDTHADTVAVLTAQLHHLDESAIRRRMDSVVRFIALSMSVQAGQKQPFRGPNADLFYCELLDVVGGILSAGTTSPNES